MDMDSILPMAVAMGCYALGLFIGILCHEYAHALAAWRLACGPRLITVGRGPILWRRRVGPAWLVLRAFPISGFAARLPAPRTRRAAIACVVAAGPLANLVILAISYVATQWSFESLALLASEAWAGVFTAQCFILIGSLLPRTTKVAKGSRRIRSDGLKLLDFLRGTDPDELAVLYAAALRKTIPPGSLLPTPSPDAPEMLYQLTRRDLADDSWAQADAAKVLTHLLNGNGLNEPERAFLADWLDLRNKAPQVSVAVA